MESTAPDLHEIIEETQNSQTLSEEEQEINYSSWDMVEFTWSEHHSKHMRERLQFCYLFPQDYEFKKNDMIQLWIALKILSIPHDETASYAEMMYNGNLCFEEYEEMNIFILSSLDHSTHLQRYKLNKSVFHLLQQQHDHDVYSKVEDISSYVSENTRHACMHDCSMNAVTLEKLYQAKRLRTLLIFHESGPKVGQVPREVFLKLPWISALDLSGTNIKEVPSSIGKLKQLRYLNLSGTSIVRLPESVCSLQEMRILKLRGCLKLVSLPNGMRRLVKLQYLDVDVARLLVSMPPGLGDLIDLHNLPAFVVGREDGCSITELKQMENLHGTLRILRLENVSSWEEAADAALDCKRHIVKLQLQWTEFHDGIQYEVLQNLQPYTQIQELQIVGFAGSKFPSWIGDPLFYQLVKITLHDCRKCKRLPPSGKLPFLKHFFVSDMQAVKAIDGLFCGREMVGGLLDFKRLVIKTMAQFTHNSKFLAFPSLEMLTLNGMPALEKWIGIEIGDFHNLQKLIITCCFKLTSLPELSLLLSLQELEISLCTSLKSLPNKGLPISLQSLIIMDCPLLKEWCLKEAKLIRGRLADIPNIWIDYMQISLNTEVSDSGRNLRARQHVYEPRTRENRQMEEQLVNHGKNKKVLSMKEIISGKNSKGLDGKDGKDLSYASAGKFSSNSNMVPPTPRTEGEILQSSNLKSFSFAELVKATRNFRADLILGEGQFGSVFRGWIDEQALTAGRPGMGITLAVKRLNPDVYQGRQEWLAEVNYLGRFYHPNLLRLVGYCLEDEHRLLVYEFMPRGSLENHLFKRGSHFQTLTWSLRMKVALGAAKGLAFLHSAENIVIHRDFKTSSILLDSNYNAKAKFPGFALAKEGPTGDESHVSTRVMETYDGYAAPEYIATGHLYAKSVVYSFGVVLLEILSGQRVINTNRPPGQHDLVEWAKPYLTHRRKIIRVLDRSLEGRYSLKDALKVAALAFRCLSVEPKSRPNMDEVVKALEGLQESKEITQHAVVQMKC